MKHEGHDMSMHDKNPPMGHAGHDHHAMMINDFKKRFYVVLILTIPIILLSPMIQHWFGYDAPGGAAASRWKRSGRTAFSASTA